MNELSLLDYLAAKLRFWRTPTEGMPSLRELWLEDDSGESKPIPEDPAKPRATSRPRFRLQRGDGPAPLGLVSALLLAFFGLVFLPGSPPVAAVLLMGAAGASYFAVLRDEIGPTFDAETVPDSTDGSGLRVGLVAGALAAAILTTVFSLGNHAGLLIAFFWLTTLAFAAAAVLIAPGTGLPSWEGIRDRLLDDPWTVRLYRTAILPTLIMLAAIAIRVADLARNPAEMMSVHAEFLWAILRVGQPDTPIVFPWGHGGLEPIPVFLTAMLGDLLGSTSFITLKAGTLVAGLATIPLIYLLGRELGGRTTGLAAMSLAAVASWPNLISRIGLADGWFPPFAAAVLLLLVRGIRRLSRLDFAAAGIVIGLGIQTASVARSLVITAVVLVAVAWIVATPERRRRLLVGIAITLVFATIAGLPTIVASATSNTDLGILWWLGSADGARGQSLFESLGERVIRTLGLPLWSSGPAWNHGGHQLPALDRVAASLLVLGTALAAIVAIRRRRLSLGLLVLAVPLLMLPAMLVPLEPSLAPSPLRCAGAVAPVFVLTGFGLASLAGAIRRFLGPPVNRVTASVVVIVLLGLSAAASHTVVHGSFADTWVRSTWNNSELGEVIRGALALGVPAERIRVVPYPHWVDTRLVGVEAGFPGTDMAIESTSVQKAASRPGPQFYLVHPDDSGTLRILRQKLPAATMMHHRSPVTGKDFMIVANLGPGGTSR